MNKHTTQFSPASGPQATLGEDHYPVSRAQGYARHHRKSLRTRLTTWREVSLLKHALRASGGPTLALDIPCGTGRFWSGFAGAGVRRLIAGDNSSGMLEVASEQIPAGLKVESLRTSVFNIDLEDGAVPFIACLRFFHHLAEPADRLMALDELRRVTSNHVAISLWTDGNLPAWRRRHKLVRATPGYGRRTVHNAARMENEFRTAGFDVVARWRAWPGLSMWTLYLLRKRDAAAQITQP